MLHENLLLASPSCDICGGEKETELMCNIYTYTDELDDLPITEKSCWSICDECSNLIKPSSNK